MSRIAKLGIAVTLIWFALPLAADSGQVAAPVTRAPVPRIVEAGSGMLVYDPRSLRDDQSARLVQAIADAVPVGSWPTIQVGRNEGLFGLVDRAYDYFEGNSQSKGTATPETARRLVDIIRKYNRLESDLLPEGMVLSIPPVLARPMAGTPSGSHVTLDLKLDRPDEPTLHLSNWRYKSDWNQDWNVDTMRWLGARSVKDVVLTMKRDVLEALANSGIGELLIRDRVELEFLTSSPCEDDFPVSPYREMARQTLAKHLKTMVGRAASTKLVLIDYDFEHGHGLEVRRVVDGLLDDLGVGDLKRMVLNFDLNPAAFANPKDHPLHRAIEHYSSYLEKISAESLADRVNAADWILFPEAPDAKRRVLRVAPFALKASLAAKLSEGAWLNLSWRADNDTAVIPTGIAQLLEAQPVFVVVAAGNEPEDILLGRAPQSEAASYLQFVNVTSGTASGQTCGSRTGAQGAKVHLLARGASLNEAGNQVLGSSFASPVVAAAAWLRHLLDETPGRRMREKLMINSSFLPTIKGRTVEARGVFDPARLLSLVGSHYVDDQGRPVPFMKMDLAVGICKWTGSAGVEPTQDLAVQDSDGKFEVVTRGLRQGDTYPAVNTQAHCDTNQFRFIATLPNGEVRQIGSVADFVARVRQVHF